MSRQQLAALSGTRGPPTELMVQGASNYRFEQARSASKTAGKPSGGAAPELPAARAALAEAEARFAAASEPVCVHDLKETALRTQKLLEDKERMVRWIFVARGGTPNGRVQPPLNPPLARPLPPAGAPLQGLLYGVCAQQPLGERARARDDHVLPRVGLHDARV